MDEMEELKQEFLSEANELLVVMEEGVLELEGDTTNMDSINAIFRVAHTLKGGAAALELNRIAVFTHNLENMFDMVRDGKLGVDEEFVDITLQSLDILKLMVDAASQSTEAQEGVESDTLQRIINKANGGETPPKIEEKKEEVQSSQPKASYSSTSSLPSVSSDAFNHYVFENFELGVDEVEDLYSRLGNDDNKIYLVSIHLDPDNEMRSVSGIQTITALKNIGSIIEGNPPIASIMEEEFVEHSDFLFLSSDSKEKIYSKVYVSDVTLSVNIREFGEEGQVSEKSESLQNVEGDLQNYPANPNSVLDKVEAQELTEEVQEEIKDALDDGWKVYQVRIWINEEVPMRDVDSLLVITTLEEVGDVISAVPSKRDLQGSDYHPVLDVIVRTQYPTEDVHNRCFIDETTLEIRIAEFKNDPTNTPEKKPIKKVVEEAKEKELDVAKASNSEEKEVPKEVVSEAQAPLETSEESSQVTTFSDRLMSKEEARVKGKVNVQAGAAAKSFLKVDSARVDSLLNLVSELVIVKAALVEMSVPTMNSINEFKMSMSDMQTILWDVASKSSETDMDSLRKVNQYLGSFYKFFKVFDTFDGIVNSVSRSINELQTGIMRIRMVTIGNVFNRFTRVVRDVSKQLNKKVVLKITGEDTELDKTVIEELADPLMHMVRNSIDHGIEMPDVRKEKGKPEEGTIHLKAMHEGGVIRIEIVDDGAGLNPDKLLSKAIEKGLVSPNQSLSVDEINQLILLPGFSTAEKITDLSGRGVGMDVVRKNIEGISGTLQIDSAFGKGSTMIIKIPLTLSIIQALIVKVKGYFYAFPLSVVSETAPFKKENITRFERSEVVYLNNEMVTIIDIKEIFNLKSSREENRKRRNASSSELDDSLLDESISILSQTFVNTADNTKNKEYSWFFGLDSASHNNEDSDDNSDNENFLVVVQSGNKRLGFSVDNIISEQDIVIKPLDTSYSQSEGVSGATILGDGSISLILDVPQLIELYTKKDSII